MLPTTEVENYTPYKTLPSSWEKILEVGYDIVVQNIKDNESISLVNNDIRKKNSELYTEAIKIAENFFNECCVPTKRYSASNPFKVLGSTKEWSLFISKLSVKYKISCPSKPSITTVYYKNERISTLSGNTLLCLESAKRTMDSRKKAEEEKKNNFQLILKTAKENDIDLSSCTNEKEMFSQVNDIMKEKWVQENYPDGTSMYLKHACDECDEWIVGERRCTCGNRRISLCVEGDFVSEFYAYPEPY